MKILVTGYKGFIGSNLAIYLQNQGHEVEGWEWQPGIIPDPSSYDWVIHLGAISSTTFTDVDQIMEQNFEYSVRLLQVCDTMGVNFQYASSASVYGPTEHFTEDGQLLPQSPYAWSKYLFDRFVNQYKDEFSILVQGFRYFNVYGPGETHKGDQASPYTKFTQQAKENGIIKLFENSKQYKRDFVCVEDLCRLHEKMFEVDQSGIFNAGTGRAVSFDTVGRTIAKKYNADIEYIPMPDTLKGQYQKYTCANLEKLNSVVDMSWTSIEDYINATTN
jgi:ADP-L-glycero-D-manno-heptose 6-epimerase